MTVIAVSGASGFVGRHLCPALASLGNRVIKISRAELQAESLDRTLEGVDAVVHLAARAHVLKDSSADPRAEFWKVNVGLTQSAARAAMRAGVKRFIFLSSAGVLGSKSPPPGFDDHSPPRPHDAYTQSKLDAELWLNAELDARMLLVILRPPVIYGPGARGNFQRLIRMAVNGWPLPIGGFRAPRSMIGVRNMVNLIAVAAAHPGALRTTVLAADAETISVADLYAAIARLAGRTPWLAPLPPTIIRYLLILTGRRSDVVRLTDPFELRPFKAQSQLGWMPPHRLADELRWTVLSELDTRSATRSRATRP